MEEANRKSSNFNNGIWNEVERKLFIEGMRIYGKKWTKIGLMIKTRDSSQVRSHAQKFFRTIDNSPDNFFSQDLLDLVRKVRS